MHLWHLQYLFDPLTFPPFCPNSACLFETPIYRALLKSGTQVAWMLQARPDRSGKHQHWPNSPNLGNILAKPCKRHLLMPILIHYARAPPEWVISLRASGDFNALGLITIRKILPPHANAEHQKCSREVALLPLSCSRNALVSWILDLTIKVLLT